MYRSIASIALACFILSSIHPAHAQADGAAPNIEPDVVYGHKHGLAMTMDFYRPGGDANGAAILFMVSGGWYSRWAPPERAKPRFQPYLDKGYRGIPADALLIGSAQQVADQINILEDQGYTDVIVRNLSSNQAQCLGSIERLSEVKSLLA